MKKNVVVLFLVLFFIVLGGAAVLSYFVFAWGKPQPALSPHSYLDIHLSGEIQEITEPNIQDLFLSRKQVSLNEIWADLRKAKTDPRIEGLLLRLDMVGCGWAKMAELRDCILDFRSAGKKAIAYIEEGLDFDKEYFLATACDKIVLHPSGWLGTNGIGGITPFFKNAFDKLGVRAEFQHVEEYKTAYNQFMEKGFTPAHKEMMESLYGDIFSRYVRTVADARKKTEPEIRALIDRGLFQPERALQSGLVDSLLYEDQLSSLLQKDGRNLKGISLEAYSRVKAPSSGLGAGRKIAVIYAIGTIMGGESTSMSMGGATVARWIRQAREDKSIAAIVFRVDSPGGSSTASDVIWRETFLAKKQKPFVVSMSDMAGSGGYWISMSAHKIVAQPQTLTGSIGVLVGKFDFSRLLEKLGVTTERMVFGKEADIFSPYRPSTPEEQKFFKEEILVTYDQFLTKVAEGRNMTKDEVHRVGRGRVWTGGQAKENKLVDELGGLTQAIESAKKLAGIAKDEDVRLVIWPKKRSFWQSVFSRPSMEIKTGLAPDLEAFLPVLRLMGKCRIWALMPFFPASD